MSDGQVLDRTAELVTLRNRLDAELTRTVRHGELTQAPEHDGIRTMRSWLVGHARLAPTEASRIVRSGRALELFPALAAGFAEGAVTAAQMDVVASKIGSVELAKAAGQGIDLAPFDEAWTTVAAEASHQTLVAAVQAFEDALDPDGPEPDPTEGRRLSIAKHADGTVTGRFDLDAVGGEKVQAAIESIVQADRPKGDERTRAQQNADAFVQLCDNQLAGGSLPTLRTVKPHVVVTVDLEDLVDFGAGPDAARTGFGATLSAARARWVACDSTITRIGLGPDRLPLDVGRTHRVVLPHLRKAVENRDGHCVFAGCGAPTHWCDVHHLVEWVNGGETSLDNSALLCERHHTKVHHGFRVQRDDGAPPGHRWRTWRPDGTEILIDHRCSELLPEVRPGRSGGR
ncbi:HNH endonuclease signature motif containing protein [Modestobacter muralis]|uniref:HNH endonuclease signature motif containing protein n=1 Tax=Modestobacter muralis TaxID=1608614 RepID=UPI001FE5B3A8|nr:HNH endonuclease signature motif containing protein [Modestobacter muralis]